MRLLFGVVFRFGQRFGTGLCVQRDGCFCVFFGLLYLDVDFRNGQQHGFFYCAALHFIFIDWFSHFDAAMRIAFGTSQWVSFSVATLLIFAGIRFEQWNGFRYAASRCIFSFSRFDAVMRVAIGISQGDGFSLTMFVNFSFAMHSVAAGCCAHGRGRRHGCRCSSLRLPSIPGRLIRDAFVHTGQV